MKTVCYSVLGFICFALVILVKPAVASENELRETLRDAKRQVRGLMNGCGELEDTSKKACSTLREVKSPTSELKRVRSIICSVSNAVPNICSSTRSYGYKIIDYADRLWNRCLQCLGGGRCHTRDQIDYCKSYVKAFQRAGSDLDHYRKKLVYQSGRYSKAMKSLRRLLNQ